MHLDTTVIHAGHPPVHEPGAFLPGPLFAATYVLPGDPANQPYTYGRFANPTWSAWEAALTALEGGPAVAFPSGMAAISAIFATVLRPGDVVVLPADAYYTTRLLAQGWLAELGVKVRLAPTRGDAQGDLLDGARLLWLETPSNPELHVCDIAALSARARAAGALVAVDNTTLTAALQQPLALGATFSVASDTKMLTGHADLLLGHVATASEEWHQKLRTWRTQGGAIPGPMETWLAHRHLQTLGLRLARQCDNAEALVACLRSAPAVQAVYYPGNADAAAGRLLGTQMKRAGCVVSFDLGTRSRAEAFLGACTLVREATSFGGIHSSAERRARWGADAVGEGFIRFSCGAEATDDLLADVTQALAAAVRAG